MFATDTFPESAPIAISCLELIENLTQECFDLDQLLDNGLIDTAIHVMEQFSSEPTVLLRGCKILSFVCGKTNSSKTCRSRLEALGCLSTLASLLERFGAQEHALCKEAQKALISLLRLKNMQNMDTATKEVQAPDGDSPSSSATESDNDKE